MRISSKIALGVLCLGCAILAAGCVSKKVEPEHKPQLGLSQSSDGILTINLDTEVGYKYTILYQDPRDLKWKVLKGCDAIIGDGTTVEIQKRVNPRKPVPHLSLTYSRVDQ